MDNALGNAGLDDEQVQRRSRWTVNPLPTHFCADVAHAFSTRPVLMYLLCACLLASFLPALRFQDGFAEEHCVLQAEAFLHGQASIDSEQHLNDLVSVGENRYLVNPPFPSLLLVPLVAVLGIAYAKGFFLALVLTFINLRQIYSIAALLGRSKSALWFTGAFFLGTGYWFCFTQSDGMWFLAHTASFTFALAAVKESLGSHRGWLMGLCLGASFLSRQATIHLGVFLFLNLLLRQAPAGRKLRSATGFLAAFGVAALFYLWFNWIRFGSPFDTGYDRLEQPFFLNERQLSHGLFHWIYIPVNAIHMFLNGFHVQLLGEDLLAGWNMNVWGTSLTFASPFVFFAFSSKLPKSTRTAAWIAIALITLHFLCYHANGWKQINCYRYSLDVMPLLLILCVSAITPANVRLWKALTVYAVSLNCLALVLVPFGNKLFQYVR